MTIMCRCSSPNQLRLRIQLTPQLSISKVEPHLHCDHPSSSSSTMGNMRSGVSNTSALRFGFSTRHLWSTAWSGTPMWIIRKYLAYDGWSLARTLEGEGERLSSVTRESVCVNETMELSSRHASLIAWLSTSSGGEWLDIPVDWVDIFTAFSGGKTWSSPGMEDNFASSTESVASVRWMRQLTSSNLRINDLTKHQS